MTALTDLASATRGQAPAGRSSSHTQVRDVDLPGHARPARLVTPARRPRGAVLWLHWLGNERSDNTHFLAEAVQLADGGCASLLPSGEFPWHHDPRGSELDAAAVAAELARARSAFDALLALAGLPPVQLAVVGHDYGAMYALAGRGFGAAGVVAIAPDATWDNWFRTYWLEGADPAASYASSFSTFDPLEGASQVQDRLLLQWAGMDEYVGPDVPVAYGRSAPRATAITYPGRDHRLGGSAAVEDRAAFLRELLDLEQDPGSR